MTTAAAGRNGAIYIDDSSAGSGSARPVTLKNHWTLTGDTDKFEVTAYGDSNKAYVTGLPNASGDLGGSWDADDTNIYNLIGSSVARKMYLYLDRLNKPLIYFFTTAFVDVSFDIPVDGAVTTTGTWTAATTLGRNTA